MNDRFCRTILQSFPQVRQLLSFRQSGAIMDCNMKLLPKRALTENVATERGTSILGSLTPSALVVEITTVAGLADRRRLAFREHLYILSRMLLSSFISSSSSGRSSKASLGLTLLSSDFKSAISSSSCRTVYSSVGSVDRVSLTVVSLHFSLQKRLDMTSQLSVKTGLVEGGEVERWLIRHSIRVESSATRSSCRLVPLVVRLTQPFPLAGQPD